MFDAAGSPAELLLAHGPDDDVAFVCLSGCEAPGWRRRRGAIYVAVHRSHDAWTHVYRVASGARGRPEVHLERVFAGARAEAARAWALARFG